MGDIFVQEKLLRRRPHHIPSLASEIDYETSCSASPGQASSAGKAVGAIGAFEQPESVDTWPQVKRKSESWSITTIIIERYWPTNCKLYLSKKPRWSWKWLGDFYLCIHRARQFFATRLIIGIIIYRSVKVTQALAWCSRPDYGVHRATYFCSWKRRVLGGKFSKLHRNSKLIAWYYK